MNIIFFGSSKHIIPVIETLNKNFSLSLVVTTEKLASQGEALRGWPAINYCIKYNIPYLSISKLSNSALISKLSAFNSSIGVLAYFGTIVPQSVLDIFPKGIINIHPSLLPKYRGPTPVQTAILNGDKITGVTIIKLDNEVDHGPILAQKEESILEEDSSETLYRRLFEVGAKLLQENLEKYTQGKLKLREQNHSKANFTKRLERKDGFFYIDNPPPPAILDRKIRAYFPWPGTWTKLKVESGELKIIKFLPNQQIQVEGKKPMSIKDFVNGYPEMKDKILRIINSK